MAMVLKTIVAATSPWVRIPRPPLLTSKKSPDLDPCPPRNRTLAGSAADTEWTAQVDADELRQLRELPGLTDLHEVPQAGGDRLLGLLRRVPGLKNQLPIVPVFQARLGLDAA
jgi:hypothetical protein